ncbi:MAG: PEP-CTERM sorting domain-containing protein [Limisphaerales bacterium]
MKKIIIMFMVALLSLQIIHGQGAITYLSNLGQSSASSDTIGSDSWLAVLFVTGGNAGGYFLNSIQLGMTDASGNPNGFTAMLYAHDPSNLAGISPGSSLGTFNGSTDPATGGIFNYTAIANMALSANTPYFIVLTAGTTIANGTYQWSLAGINSYNPSGGWHSSGGVLTSNNGSSWSFNPIVAQFAINATPIPEPGILSLFSLGGLGFLRYRRKAKAD